MFFTMRKKFRPLQSLQNNYLFSNNIIDYIIRTTHNSIDKNNQNNQNNHNYQNNLIKKSMYKLNYDTNLTNEINNNQYEISLVCITSFTIGIISSFLFFYRFKK
jgi:DNA replication protein DnaC